VKSGDTLYDIAIAFNTTVKAIQELNGLGSNTTLHVGQKLKIP
jgi:membrane-bound lytic murein transglycosylase D